MKKGIVRLKGTSILPTMAETECCSMPTRFAIAIIGIPTAPKATGAVFAIRQSPAACKGRKPSPTKSAAVIATGPPKPIAPSKNEPKQKPIKIT